MSQFETSESPKEVFGELGKRWIKQVKITKDFRSIFMRHLSDFASRCFEVYSAPNLKAAINEEKCQRIIFTALEYFLCGEDPIVGFQKLLNANSPSQLCGKVFKVGEPTYSCRDCGYDNTCVLCINCFQKSIHKNHHYKMNTSGGGGVCDCGDVEAWKEGEACEIHQQGQDVDMEEDPISKLPLDIVERGVALYDAVLNYCIDLICWDKTDELPEYLDVSCIADTFATVLFNDEVHTYEEVIRTLQLAIPDCTQNQALAFANTVDREGRSVVRTGSYSQCEQSRKTIKQGTSGPSRKPLKCRVMHHKVVAHQMCAVQMLGWLSKITNYSDGFRRILSNTVLAFKEGPDLLKRVLLADSSLWKVARAHTQKLFINTMLMDPVGKKAFAVHFTKNYCQLYKDFVDDDHEHSVSVTCLSVQLFTVPTLARMLLLEQDVLEVIIFSFMDHLRPAISGEIQYNENKCSLSFGLTGGGEGMDMTTRKIGRHIETEPDWEASFTLQFRVTPVISLVWDWCASDLLVFKSAILKTIQTLHESRKKLPEENVTHFQECEQVYNYLNVRGRSIMFDKDVVMLQVVASCLDSDYFIAALLDKFGLVEWSKPDFNDSRYDQEKLNQKMTIAESFMSMLIAVIGERYSPGIGCVSSNEFMRREIIHKLCLRPMTHSELVKALLSDSDQEDDECIDAIIDSVSTFKYVGLVLWLRSFSVQARRSASVVFVDVAEHPQSLVMSLQILHDGAETCKEHAALLDWIVKTLHEELTTHQEKHHEVCRTRPSLERIVSQEEEKAKKARMAQERRAKIMAQMSALQKAFIKENAELLASMETDDNNSAESHHMVTSANCSQQEPIVLGVQRCQQEVGTPRYVTEPCILCQESQEVNIDGRAVVMAAFVQRSTVMSHSRGKMFEDGDKLDPLYAPSDQYWGVHVSSCGHMMHSDCWQGFYKSVIAKERRTLRVVHYFSVDIARNEFLCPLCGCISNTVLPILPALFNAQGEGCTEDVTIAEFLSSVQDEVSSNLRLFCKDTKKGKKASATVSDSFQAVFRTLLKTGTKFSNDLKAMMRVFAQACFMVGLGVDPNEEDSRVPVLVWKACAYTIQSGESSARAEGKAVFSGLGSRQFQCMAALTRQAAVISGLFSSNDVQQHCLRLLSVLTPDAVPGADGPSLLDLDLFSLLVMLRLVLPSMLYQESVDKRSKPALKSIIGLNSPVFMDQCVFRVTLVMRIENCFVFICAGTNISLSSSLRNFIFVFFLLSSFRWCSHEHTKRTLATAGVESLGYSIEANRLMKIPMDYSELINEASLFTCPNSDGDDSRAPALCLVCGAMLCSQSYCCQTEVEGGEKVGACAAHAQKCGAGVGVFLRVRECHILLMANKNKGCFYSPPYLDAYGETDQGLRRGNPLYLCHERYQKLEKLWLNHAVAEEVARCLESNRNLLSIDWTNL
ncbi:PREDICTED: LOW QUALITY PROTEIN: E3 ubiquitin-protein ligase UBR2-like [Acropora digitifera]|uniref:LOW QUALITY PROTEIN: E3 ubiquitin-protein ligase UBR2-like n=1 Tax=Acropora digitifera TaxID=70779 RepID=UPI00077AC3BC|nr:PREDICTED: LOW QUALITY PROTEIN: E3 ubiquitin-protein ligase UBR2-like [Acropora digitifera]